MKAFGLWCHKKHLVSTPESQILGWCEMQVHCCQPAHKVGLTLKTPVTLSSTPANVCQPYWSAWKHSACDAIKNIPFMHLKSPQLLQNQWCCRQRFDVCNICMGSNWSGFAVICLYAFGDTRWIPHNAGINRNCSWKQMWLQIKCDVFQFVIPMKFTQLKIKYFGWS